MNEEEFNTEDVVAKIRKLQQQNLGKIQALSQSGAQIDPGALANIKIDLFVEMFLDEKAQVTYVHNLEVRIQQALDEALASVRQSQIVQGTPAANTGSLSLPKR